MVHTASSDNFMVVANIRGASAVAKKKSDRETFSRPVTVLPESASCRSIFFLFFFKDSVHTATEKLA